MKQNSKEEPEEFKISIEPEIDVDYEFKSCRSSPKFNVSNYFSEDLKISASPQNSNSLKPESNTINLQFNPSKHALPTTNATTREDNCQTNPVIISEKDSNSILFSYISKEKKYDLQQFSSEKVLSLISKDDIVSFFDQIYKECDNFKKTSLIRKNVNMMVVGSIILMLFGFILYWIHLFFDLSYSNGAFWIGITFIISGTIGLILTYPLVYYIVEKPVRTEYITKIIKLIDTHNSSMNVLGLKWALGKRGMRDIELVIDCKAKLRDLSHNSDHSSFPLVKNKNQINEISQIQVELNEFEIDNKAEIFVLASTENNFEKGKKIMENSFVNHNDNKSRKSSLNFSEIRNKEENFNESLNLENISNIYVNHPNSAKSIDNENYPGSMKFKPKLKVKEENLDDSIHHNQNNPSYDVSHLSFDIISQSSKSPEKMFRNIGLGIISSLPR